MAQANVRLTRFISATPAGSAEPLAHKLVIEAVGTNIPSEIFVMHRSLTGTDASSAVFESVASPTTLEEYPISPDTELDEENQLAQPYYRVSRIELIFEHADELEETYNYIVADTSLLVRSYNALDRLELSGSVILDGIESVETGTDGQSSPITVTKMEWKPAGDPALSGADQIILNPDTLLKGWLPVSEYVGEVPAGAVFFYNLEQDPVVEVVVQTEMVAPFPVFSLNGAALPSEIIKVDGGQIWWMYFESESFFFPLDGNAPWPLDYAGADYPNTPPVLTISQPQ